MLGAGCYWGTEKFIKQDFAKKNKGTIMRVRVGFMGSVSDPPEPSASQ